MIGGKTDGKGCRWRSVYIVWYMNGADWNGKKSIWFNQKKLDVFTIF